MGDFGYIADGNDDAGEALNFRPYRKKLYGYSPARTLNLRRLGGNADADHLDNVLVIWTATNPEEPRGRYITGWYKNARVYREEVKRRPDAQRPSILAEASARNCQLVPADQRTFWIPRMKKGWPGIHSAFYASAKLSDENLQQIIAYVDGEPSTGFYDLFHEGHDKERPESGGNRGRKPVDQAAKSAVERAAVDHVISYYKAQKWDVDPVEQDNRGWDLEVTNGGRKLLVEVKGRDGVGGVEFSPNEYKKMHLPKYRMNYRVAVVWHSRSDEPVLMIFDWRPKSETWVAEDGTVLTIRPETGGVGSIKQP